MINHAEMPRFLFGLSGRLFISLIVIGFRSEFYKAAVLNIYILYVYNFHNDPAVCYL